MRSKSVAREPADVTSVSREERPVTPKRKTLEKRENGSGKGERKTNRV